MLSEKSRLTETSLNVVFTSIHACWRVTALIMLLKSNGNQKYFALSGRMTEDDGFQAELLLSFYRESVEHANRLAGAVAAHQAGQSTFDEDTPGGRLRRSIEQVLKDEAHALKGSSATLELTDIAAVSVVTCSVWSC